MNEPIVKVDVTRRAASEPMRAGRVPAWRIWAARGIAVGADVLQIAVFPLFGEGAISPLNAGLDVAAAVLLVFLVGWHIAFVPTFIVEMLPFADLAPTWTVAVLIATRRGRGEDKRGG